VLWRFTALQRSLLCALTELLTQYGELREVWFDGACAEGPSGRKQVYDWERFFSIVKKLQPEAVTFGDGGTDVRWVGNERGYAGETCWGTVDPRRVRYPGDSGIDTGNDAMAHTEFLQTLNSGDRPDGDGPRVWRPAECDVSIRPGWFYHEAEDAKVRSVENLTELYFQSVGRNSLLLLNVPPTPEGLFHDADIAALSGFRRERDRLFARQLGSSKNGEIELTTAETVSLIELREPVSRGQRVARYRVEAQSEDGAWIELSRGTTIGHQKLDRVSPIKTRRVRLHLDEVLNSPSPVTISLY
jgi:alpha-L-fucosidase